MESENEAVEEFSEVEEFSASFGARSAARDMPQFSGARSVSRRSLVSILHSPAPLLRSNGKLIQQFRPLVRLLRGAS